MGPCHLRSAPRDYSRVPNVRHFYIFHLPDAARGEVNTALYADQDDSKIFGAVRCARDCEAVQSTLSNMASWKRCNNIQSVNSSKCKVLTVTRKKQPFRYDYTLNKVLLKKVPEEKAREGPRNHCHQHTFMGQAYQRRYIESK